MKIMFSLICLTALVLTGADFALVRDGKPVAGLVCPEPTSKMRVHLNEFNTELSRCSGTRLPILKEPSKTLNNIVFVLKKVPMMMEDAFEIDFPNAGTMRISGTEISICWAFNHLLEKEIGIRWFFPPAPGLYGPEINHYPLLSGKKISIGTR